MKVSIKSKNGLYILFLQQNRKIGMSVNTLNYLLSLDIDKLQESQEEISLMDGSQILELFELAQIETAERLNKYKIDKNSLIQEITSLVSQYTIREIVLLKCNFILVLLCSELCERLTNNINEQISIYSNLKKEIASEILKPFYECINKFDNSSLSLIDNNIAEIVEKACLRFSNIDNEIEFCANNIYNLNNIKLLLEFEFSDDTDNTNTNIVKYNTEIKNGLNDSLEIAEDVLIAGLAGGEQGAINAVCANSEKIADTAIKLIENAYKKINEQDTCDKQGRIKYISEVLEYAKLISNVFNIDVSNIFNAFEEKTEKLNNLKNNAKQELIKLESLITKFDFNNESCLNLLRQNIDIINEILNISNDCIV